MAIWLPPAISYMFISLYADDGVGVQFRHAFWLEYCYLSYSTNHDYDRWWLSWSLGAILSNMTIQIGQVGAVIGIEKPWVLCYGYFKDNTLPVHATTVDTISADKLNPSHSFVQKNTVYQRLFNTITAPMSVM